MGTTLILTDNTSLIDCKLDFGFVVVICLLLFMKFGNNFPHFVYSMPTQNRNKIGSSGSNSIFFLALFSLIVCWSHGDRSFPLIIFIRPWPLHFDGYLKLLSLQINSIFISVSIQVTKVFPWLPLRRHLRNSLFLCVCFVSFVFT